MAGDGRRTAHDAERREGKSELGAGGLLVAKERGRGPWKLRSVAAVL
uniref:Uncharacterized protein n=1 Tax=Arundo donax TaxID=35708 RepID=A0A0A8Z5F3_ARUDO